MRKSTKIAGVLMVAGIVAAGGSAATGNGFTSNVAANQFIGGTVSTTVVGATLSSVAYLQDTSDPTGRKLTGVRLVFADANTDGKTPTVTTVGGTAGTFTCDAVASHTVNGSAVAHSSVCDDGGTASNDAEAITGLSITVS